MLFVAPDAAYQKIDALPLRGAGWLWRMLELPIQNRESESRLNVMWNNARVTRHDPIDIAWPKFAVSLAVMALRLRELKTKGTQGKCEQ